MAGGKQPPDKTNQKNFACHPKTAFNFVICLICENAYHQSDYNRKKIPEFELVSASLFVQSIRN